MSLESLPVFNLVQKPRNTQLNQKMNRFGRILSLSRLCSQQYVNTNVCNIRYQPRLNYSELPRVKKPGEGKGPITWKSVRVIVVGGAVLYGVLKFMEARKDAGKAVE